MSEIQREINIERKILELHKQKCENLRLQKDEKKKLIDSLKEELVAWEDKRTKWSTNHKDDYAESIEKAESLKTNIKKLAFSLGC